MKPNSITRLIIFIATIALSSGCVYHKPEFTGQVLDKETKQPIKGAVVVAVYGKEMLGITGAGSLTKTINVREALTDKKGMFIIPSYTTIITPLSWSRKTTFIIFKPGYGAFPSLNVVLPTDQEAFFSEDFGREREIETMRKSAKNGPEFYHLKVPYGIVELSKVSTREERIRARMAADILGFDISESKLPLLLKTIQEERNNGY